MKTLRTLFVSMIAIAAIVYSHAATGQSASEEWQQLGIHEVDYTLDYDVIPVTYKKGTFTTLKIKVNGGNINMYRCMITFENGDKQEIEIKHQFTAGGEKVIDLKGNTRIIEKVTFWYDTKSKSSQKATVEVWGKK